MRGKARPARRQLPSSLKMEWLTTAEAAKYLKVSRRTLYDYCAKGLLPWYEMPMGRGRRFKREDLDKVPTRHAAGETKAE